MEITVTITEAQVAALARMNQISSYVDAADLLAQIFAKVELNSRKQQIVQAVMAARDMETLEGVVPSETVLTTQTLGMGTGIAIKR